MIIFALVCFLTGYFVAQWLIPGYELAYMVAWLIACFPLHWIIQAFKQRNRFGFVRRWPGNAKTGWGFFGEPANNDGYIIFDWSVGIIVWRKPRTYYTRAMFGGFNLKPLRTWFLIEEDAPC